VLLDDAQTFWRRWGFFARESSRTLWKWCGELRQVWEGSPFADDIINGWLTAQPSTFDSLARRRWIVGPGRGVLPNSTVLPLVLALSVAELGPRLGICANPECALRYFIRSKAGQRFCGGPECAVIAQREFKRRWWAEHGKEWRKRRERQKKSRKRRH
jgi:hypothetical protein